MSTRAPEPGLLTVCPARGGEADRRQPPPGACADIYDWGIDSIGMAENAPLRRWPTTIKCDGLPDAPHERVTWLGDWVPENEDSCEPECFVCGNHGMSTAPRYPYKAMTRPCP